MINSKHWLKRFLTLAIIMTAVVLLWIILTPSESSKLFLLSFSFNRFVMVVLAVCFLVLLSIGLAIRKRELINKIFSRLMASKLVFLFAIVVSVISLGIVVGAAFGIFGIYTQIIDRTLPLITLVLLIAVEVLAFQLVISHGEIWKSVSLPLVKAGDWFASVLETSEAQTLARETTAIHTQGGKSKSILFLKKIWEKILVIGCVLGVLLPVSPGNLSIAYRDSGTFLYTGWRILNGALPFKDVWDHKPPVIFYINTLGLFLSNNSRWGVWVLEVIFLLIAAYTGYRLFKKAFGVLPAAFSLVFWLMTLVFVIQGGNLTTEYTLPMQFIALTLFYHIDETSHPKRRWLIIGLLGGIAFFTKQTAVGIWIGLFIYNTVLNLKSHQVKKWVADSLALAAGFLIIIAGWIIFFGVQGGLADFWKIGFLFNFAYTDSVAGLSPRLNALKLCFDWLLKNGVFQVPLTGFVLGILLLVIRKKRLNCISVLVIGLIDLPIELILIATSGKTMQHYYMTLLPALAILSAFFLWVLMSILSNLKNKKIIVPVVLTFSMLLFLGFTLPGFWREVKSYASAKDEGAITFLLEHTIPDDTVLMWGAESYVNFATKRSSPTRYVYQYPLYYANYADEDMILEFLNDLIQNQPKYIVDTKNLEAPMYIFPIHSVEIDEKVELLKNRYKVVENFGTWDIYKKMDEK